MQMTRPANIFRAVFWLAAPFALLAQYDPSLMPNGYMDHLYGGPFVFSYDPTPMPAYNSYITDEVLMLESPEGNVKVEYNTGTGAIKNYSTADSYEVLRYVMSEFCKYVKVQEAAADIRYRRRLNFAELLLHVDSVSPDNNPAHRRALNSALLAWRSILGPLGISPKLMEGGVGSCDLDGNGMACVVSGNGNIFIDHIDTDVDLRSVMMHEVGHLLGVPHIEGDALMNKSYLGKVETPTPASVALARLSMSARRHQ